MWMQIAPLSEHATVFRFLSLGGGVEEGMGYIYESIYICPSHRFAHQVSLFVVL
jgi:hypothetical protein